MKESVKDLTRIAGLLFFLEVHCFFGNGADMKESPNIA